jgi:hypothetical protein
MSTGAFMAFLLSLSLRGGEADEGISVALYARRLTEIASLRSQ